MKQSMHGSDVCSIRDAKIVLRLFLHGARVGDTQPQLSTHQTRS